MHYFPFMRSCGTEYDPRSFTSATSVPQEVTCPNCLLIMAERSAPDYCEKRASELARELVSTRLMAEDPEYPLAEVFERTDEVMRAEPTGVHSALVAVLVDAVAATWDDLDDFSAHVIRALADDDA